MCKCVFLYFEVEFKKNGRVHSGKLVLFLQNIIFDTIVVLRHPGLKTYTYKIYTELCNPAVKPTCKERTC